MTPHDPLADERGDSPARARWSADGGATPPPRGPRPAPASAGRLAGRPFRLVVRLSVRLHAARQARALHRKV